MWWWLLLLFRRRLAFGFRFGFAFRFGWRPWLSRLPWCSLALFDGGGRGRRLRGLEAALWHLWSGGRWWWWECGCNGRKSGDGVVLSAVGFPSHNVICCGSKVDTGGNGRLWCWCRWCDRGRCVRQGLSFFHALAFRGGGGIGGYALSVQSRRGCGEARVSFPFVHRRSCSWGDCERFNWSLRCCCCCSAVGGLGLFRRSSLFARTKDGACRAAAAGQRERRGWNRDAGSCVTDRRDNRKQGRTLRRCASAFARSLPTQVRRRRWQLGRGCTYICRRGCYWTLFRCRCTFNGRASCCRAWW